jgi:hypothetical protein
MALRRARQADPAMDGGVTRVASCYGDGDFSGSHHSRTGVSTQAGHAAPRAVQARTGRHRWPAQHAGDSSQSDFRAAARLVNKPICFCFFQSSMIDLMKTLSQ